MGLVAVSAYAQDAKNDSPPPEYKLSSVPCEDWGEAYADGQYPKRDAALFRYVLDIPGGYVNDHCLIRADGLWHLFFIQGEVAKEGEVWSRPGNEVKFGHAVSKDLLHWKLLEPALKVSPPGRLDSGHIYAPCVIEWDGVYYMLYAGLIEERYGIRIFLATSRDLFHWEKHPANPVFQSDPSWAAYRPKGFKDGPAGPAGCRDPYVIRHPEHGFILYFAEHMKADPQRPAKPWEYAAIGAATSKDLVHWQDRGPVLIRARNTPERSRPVSPESPCVIHHNNRYYLFWKQGSGTRYTMSDNPLDFRDREVYFLATSHAGKVFSWGERWFVTSCSRYVDDVDHKHSDRTRGLFIAGLEWDGLWPRVRRLSVD